MKKQCSTCEFNFGGTCAGHGDVYQYGETISDDRKCCNNWGASFEYFRHETTTAPRFLRDAYNDHRISYQEFSKQVDDFHDGKPVPLSIFDAVKYIYGISMVDIAVVLDVTYGVVYRAKTKGFVKKRIAQFADGLCIPEKLLFNVTTNDFEELLKGKEQFFAKPNINKILESMPDWKLQLAQEISSFYVRCPIHLAKTMARVDHLYWNSDFSMDGYTESERVFISYVSRETKKHEPIHHLEYFLDIACSPHIQTRAMLKEDFFEEK